MALTPDEQKEFDELEFQKLLSERNSATAAAVDPSTAFGGGSVPTDGRVFDGSGGGAPVPEDGSFAPLLDKAANLGIRAGLPAGGQALGELTGPFSPIAVPVLGAAGGVAGELIANSRENIPNTTGKILRAGISGLIPGAPLAGAADREVLREAGKYAATSLVGNTAQSLADNSKLPDLGSAVGDAATAAMGAPAAAIMSTARILTAAEKLYADRDAAIAAVRPDGVVVPPHLIDKGSDVLTSAAGPAAVEREASKQNIFTFQKMAREDLPSLAPDALPIRIGTKTNPAPDTLNGIRQSAAEPYQTVQQISEDAQQKLQAIRDQFPAGLDAPAQAQLDEALNTPLAKALKVQAGADVDQLKSFRQSAQDAYERLKSGDSDAYADWIKNKDAASAMEDQIQSAAALSGDDSLVSRLQNSRKIIAQTYSVENALNRTTGLVDPRDFARQLNNNVPLTGNLKKIADFANAVPRAAQGPERILNPNVGKATMLVAADQASRGDVPGMLGGIVTSTVGKPARAILLSDLVQNSLFTRPERVNFSAAFARYLADQARDDRQQQMSDALDQASP